MSVARTPDERSQRPMHRSRREPSAPPKRVEPAANPIIEITPTPEEYEQLSLDLTTLRRRGAPSNTAAVLAAVHAAATR
jgi:hypothetical protein